MHRHLCFFLDHGLQDEAVKAVVPPGVQPAQMLFAGDTHGNIPGVTRKPGELGGRLPQGKAHRVREAADFKNQAVRIGKYVHVFRVYRGFLRLAGNKTITVPAQIDVPAAVLRLFPDQGKGGFLAFVRSFFPEPERNS